MSYNQFKFGKPKLEKAIIKHPGSTSVSVEVTNTGITAGDEIVQMYIRDKVSSVTRPVKELTGFQRISLKPGEKKNVILKIRPEQLAFYDINMEYVAESGDFDNMGGNSSRDEDLQVVTFQVTK